MGAMPPTSFARVPLFPEQAPRPSVQPVAEPEPAPAFLVRVALPSGYVVRYEESTREDAERRVRSCNAGLQSGRIAQGATVTLSQR